MEHLRLIEACLFNSLIMLVISYLPYLYKKLKKKNVMTSTKDLTVKISFLFFSK